MWIVFSVFLVLWLVSIEFYFPPALIVTFFAALIGSAAVGLIPNRAKQEVGSPRK